jgi:hypothetical protein
MPSNKKISFKRSATKLLLAGILSFGAVTAFAQTLPSPPPPPPSPAKLWKKINPFKKGKIKLPPYPKSNLKTPPPPPDPIDAVKKIKLPKPPPRPER